MEIGIGQRYTATVNGLTVPTNGGTAFDLFQLATSSSVTCLVDRIVCTANGTNVIPLCLLRRSTTGTGGTGITPSPTSPSAPASSTTVSYNVVTTVGTAGALIDSQLWNEFAPYEFNEKPGGILIPASSFLCLAVTTAPSATFPASFTVEFIDFK